MTPDQTNNLTPEELKKLKRKEYNKQYRIKNLDRAIENGKRYYRENKKLLDLKNKDYRKNYYIENKVEINRKQKIFGDTHIGLNAKRCKEYAEKHIESIKKYRDSPEFKEKEKKRRIKNKEKLKIQQAEYYIENKERINKRNSEFKKRNRKSINEAKKIKYRNDILYRIRELCRANIRRVKKFGFKKNSKTEKLIGCPYEEFQIYFQSKFNQYMTWPHFMAGLIHIDHIIPLSSATSQEEIEKLCNYTNLQPLWATTKIAREHGDMFSIGNLEKSNKV